MDSMSAQDAAFLHLENEFNPMHIGVVAVFEGPPPDGRAIEQAIASKLDHVPRYRQCVREVPFDLGQPVWIDDDHFDLDYHVRHTALPSPGSGNQLHTLVGRVMSQKLDRRRPLWEIWVVEGLVEGWVEASAEAAPPARWALISKTHPCLVDGVAGSELMGALLDSERDAEPPPATPWQPAKSPSGWSLVASSITAGWKAPREGLQAIARAAGAPRRALQELARFSDGLASFRSLSGAHLESSLNGPIGPHRRWCSVGTTIDDIRKIRRAHGGTVNDVLLYAVASGFRTLLRSRGESVEGSSVRTLVPVSVRRDTERGAFDNRVAAVFVDLPMDVADPVERLTAVREAMDALEQHHRAEASETLSALSGHSPPVLLALGARLFARLDQHLFQTVTTNVPGPRRPLFAARRRMLHAYPYLPLTGSVRMAIAIFSYAGTVGFGITGDYESAADLGVLASGIERGLAELQAVS